MYITQEDIARIKQEITTVQSQREASCPYDPRLKREIINYVVQELAESDPFYEVAGKLGLYGDQLRRWFKETIQKEVSTPSE